MVRLDRAAAEPLHQQLYQQIRDELVSGTFSNGASGFLRLERWLLTWGYRDSR